MLFVRYAKDEVALICELKHEVENERPGSETESRTSSSSHIEMQPVGETSEAASEDQQRQSKGDDSVLLFHEMIKEMPGKLL